MHACRWLFYPAKPPVNLSSRTVRYFTPPDRYTFLQMKLRKKYYHRKNAQTTPYPKCNSNHFPYYPRRGSYYLILSGCGIETDRWGSKIDDRQLGAIQQNPRPFADGEMRTFCRTNLISAVSWGDFVIVSPLARQGQKARNPDQTKETYEIKPIIPSLVNVGNFPHSEPPFKH